MFVELAESDFTEKFTGKVDKGEHPDDQDGDHQDVHEHGIPYGELGKTHAERDSRLSDKNKTTCSQSPVSI